MMCSPPLPPDSPFRGHHPAYPDGISGPLSSKPSLGDTSHHSCRTRGHVSRTLSALQSNDKVNELLDSCGLEPDEIETSDPSPALSPALSPSLLSSPHASPSSLSSGPALPATALLELNLTWEPEKVGEYSDSDEGDAPVSEEGDVGDQSGSVQEGEVNQLGYESEEEEEVLVPVVGGVIPGESDEDEDDPYPVTDTQHLEQIREIEESVEVAPPEKRLQYKSSKCPISLPLSCLLPIDHIKDDIITLRWWVEKFKVS